MKMSFAMMKIEWHNDAANDSRSHAIKILLRTDRIRWHFCFSPKMFSYLLVLLSGVNDPNMYSIRPLNLNILARE